MMPMMFWSGGFVLVLLLLGAVVAAVVLAERSSRRTDDGADLLRMRYASGEIDTEEYRRRLTELRTTDRPTP
jgi:uncharacterized membrane protein